MSAYEAFSIHMEVKSLHELSARILAGGKHADPVVDAELKNLANELDARLQKVVTGVTKVPGESDWLL